jgi:hypothetical protein
MRKIDRHDRETFIAALLAAVPTATRADALRLLRWGRTYGRLCEAECNGDYPADGPWTYNHLGKRRPLTRQCPCESSYAASSFSRGVCPSCRAERIIRETCARMGETDALGTPFFGGTDKPHPSEAQPWCVPHFQGDPRGHTVRLQIAGAPLDAYERPALAVPTS